ncbi:Epsin-3, clathrin recruitment and traffic between the Golgi and endosome [Podospora pseudopauciseta]|uniref:Epsin-3, clathrin recruitment and traffic between the Golgi and endosome n=1 Tax=Podospora pseudopauciseta TaxID=2093780 RepID=A0ABR0HX16_9PEZI|nr:Epsin-3, clathrin recruitment and traffic between the Golgi and endosome [Podospora pseudopauciseta]
MDLNSLRQTVTNLTLYDVKAGVRKVQNAVMNFTEMEAKVREATNNEPWGASSTQMQEIADGTFNYQTLNEIMPMIYRRFTEKSAEEWRQIYKALQLLEYLIKHGSERVIDDARSHITLLKMLRQFHFIDQNGKDQGVNVRHRAKELAELLGDVDRIRSERKKARAIKGKFVGMQGGSGMGSSSRYGGFGSNSDGYSGGGGGGSSSTYGGDAGGVYGDGGGFGGQQSSDFGRTQARGEQFEEYDEFDGDERPAGGASSSSAPRVKRDTSERVGVKKTTEPAKKKAPEVDLFSFDEPATTSTPPLAGAPAASSAALTNDDDDDFDDFQSAVPTVAAAPATQFAAPQPVSAPQQANLSGMVAMSSISPPPSSTATPSGNFSAFSTPLSATTLSPAAKPAGFQASTPNYFSSVQAASPAAPVAKPAAAPASFGGLKPVTSGSKPAAPAAGGDAFGSLWSQASVGLKKSTPTGPGPTIGQLAKEKSSAGIWGAASSSPAAAKPAGSKPLGNGLDDLLG